MQAKWGDNIISGIWFSDVENLREGGQHEKLGRDVVENEVGWLGSTTVSIVIETTGKKTGEAEACDEASDGDRKSVV